MIFPKQYELCSTITLRRRLQRSFDRTKGRVCGLKAGKNTAVAAALGGQRAVVDLRVAVAVVAVVAVAAAAATTATAAAAASLVRPDAFVELP